MRLPPLTAVKYFTVAAKHQNFKKAAAELFVTEGAVSRQIKLLEEYYGNNLFDRVHRGVKLTDAGKKLYSVSFVALNNISDVSHELIANCSPINISASTSFAIRWLMPRLPHFERKNPDIFINLQTVRGYDLENKSVFDASIIYIIGNPQDILSKNNFNKKLVLVEWLIPVCSTAYTEKHGPINVFELNKHRIITNEETGRDWCAWNKLMPEAKLDLDSALIFEHDDTAIQAAVAGHGIALANLAYINNELQSKSLVKAVECDPFPIGGHYLSIANKKRNEVDLDIFCEWLLKSATEDPSQTGNKIL